MIWTVLGIAIVIAGVLATLVIGGRQNRAADVAIDHVVDQLGLADEGKVARGFVDGVRVTLYQDLTYAFREIDVFSHHTRADGSSPISRAAAAAVKVTSAPADLKFGQQQPLLRNAQELGNEEFDRAFALRESDSETLAYLTERRCDLFLRHPIAWFGDGWFVTRVGDEDADVMVSNVRALVDTAQQLDSATE